MNRKTYQKGVQQLNLREIIKLKAFTLIELIVVMAVIGILVLLAAPKFLGYTERAQDTRQIHTAKVIETALEVYLIHGGVFPDNLDTVDQALLDEKLSNEKLLGVDGYITSLDGETYYELTNEFIQKLDIKLSADGKVNKIFIEALAAAPNAVYSTSEGVTLIDKSETLKGYSVGGGNESDSNLPPPQVIIPNSIKTSYESDDTFIQLVGVDAKINDGDINTFASGQRTITWTGNMAHREVEITAAGIIYSDFGLRFLDDAGKVVRPIGSSSDVVIISKGANVTTSRVVVPEGANRMHFFAISSSYHVNMKLYEVKVPDNTSRPSDIKLNVMPTTNSMELTWEPYSKAVIYRDGVYINTVIGQTYTDKLLYSDMDYNYTIVYIDDSGNGQEISYDTKTAFNIAAFRGVSPLVFDSDLDSFATGSMTATWIGNLANREIEIVAAGITFSDYRLQFRDTSNNIIRVAGASTDYLTVGNRGNITTSRITVPEGADRMYFYAASSSYDINMKLYEIKILD